MTAIIGAIVTLVLVILVWPLMQLWLQVTPEQATMFVVALAFVVGAVSRSRGIIE